MADNATLPATGLDVATDDVGGVHYQKLKLDAGGDGVSVPVVAGQQLAAASIPVVLSSDVNTVTLGAGSAAVGKLAASENVIGLVGASDIVVTINPTTEAAAFAAGDLLFDSTEIVNAVRANGYTCILQSITLLDDADQGVPMTLVFANAATDFGTLNSAPDPDDAEAATVIGHVEIAAGDYIDLGASKIACIKNIGLLLKAGAATTSIYVAGINGASAPTYAATDDLHIALGFLRS